MGRRVSVGAYAVIEAEAKIGDGSVIGAGTVVGRGVSSAANAGSIPARCSIPEWTSATASSCMPEPYSVPTASATCATRRRASMCSFHSRVVLIIEDGVEIGANTTIDRGALDETRIARGVKIDNLVHIGHNVQVGKDVVIAAQTGISGQA